MDPEGIDRVVRDEITRMTSAPESQFTVQGIRHHIAEVLYPGKISEAEVEKSLIRLFGAGEIEYDEQRGKLLRVLPEL